MHAMPVMIVILCLMAIAYRYYSAFLAARVAALDDARVTPAVKFEDGQNFHSTNKWVLFGHHFAAISGAGPLIGPVLAAQFGYMPGLLWIVIGVCLAGAVQDFLVLAASIRRGGMSLAQIARTEVGPVAGVAAMTAILFIIVIALAGLGAVVKKALGGESQVYPAGSAMVLPAGVWGDSIKVSSGVYQIPAGTSIIVPAVQEPIVLSEPFLIKTAAPMVWKETNGAGDTMDRPGAAMDRADGALTGAASDLAAGAASDIAAGAAANPPPQFRAALPAGSARLIPGSSWGTFTIFCTIPIALFVGLYMYKLRPGKILEASVIGGLLTLAATVAGAWVSQHAMGSWFNLTATQVVIAMAIYGFVAAVLPVWVLLTPRDYLSSFLKIGTIVLLVAGVIIANPELKVPAINHAFINGGPTVNGSIFPFLFITIMCGAISGFHSLVSSGTTPKMIRRESDARMIGYGAMLIEGLVGVVAMISATCLSPGDYYAMNTDLSNVPAYHDKFVQIGAGIDHLNYYDQQTQESLRGRTGGAVTLAVGMAYIFDQAMGRFAGGMQAMWKYWYHFAIMFEALFILTTIDAGTRIGRFLVQELMGRIHPKLGRTDWWPGAIFATALIVAGWTYFILFNTQFSAIWSMFGIANQMLAVIALAVVSVVLVNDGKLKYLWVTVCPLLLVATTTTTAATELLDRNFVTLHTQWLRATPDHGVVTAAVISASLIALILGCTYIIIAAAAMKILPKLQREGEMAPSVALAK